VWVAKTMPISTGLVCDGLLAQLKGVESTSAISVDISLLSASDSAFLKAASEPPDAAFAAAWPADQALAADGMSKPFLALAAEVLKQDPRVQKRCDRLVPKKMTEAAFWRSYCSALYTIFASLPAAAEAEAEAGLATLRVSNDGAGERRFKRAAGKLLAEGDLPRDKILRFTRGVAAALVR